MPVNSKLYLPGNVRFGDVQRVLARLYGHSEEAALKFEPSDDFTSGSLFVPTLKAYEDQDFVFASKSGEVFHVGAPKAPADAVPVDRYYWSFEGENGTRYLHRIANPWSIAVFKALADFFGGVVDFQDTDSSYTDHDVPFKSNDLNCPTDGQVWYDLQARIEAVAPLTLARSA